MTKTFDSLCLNEGVWEGVWTYFRPPTDEQPSPEAINQRTSTLIFERLGPSRLRQTNRYHGQGELVWEYEDAEEGLRWFEIKGEERKPGDPNFIAAIRPFSGENCFTSGYLRLMENLPFISEQGIVVGERKRRGMVMFDRAGAPATLIAIRETRNGTLVDDDHAVVTVDDLLGEWSGEARMVTAAGTEETALPARLLVRREDDRLQLVSAFGDNAESVAGTLGEGSVRLENGHRLVFLPGRILLGYPEQIPASGNRAFTVSLWWWPEPTRLRRMVREYDEDGAWRRTLLTDERRGR
ncbi:MAG: DUF3598 family protein [Chloroflexota bacterium]|nr:DUF3598 family protein [Dehalococcoidia bacterium]MDW8253479.1 DUF3598 family protein [Chloroflexota bacterium]